jgi:hypothetical protein
MTACLLLAHSGHATYAQQCPLSGVKRTSTAGNPMSASDPERTWEAEFALKGLRFVLIGKDDTERTLARR